MAGPRLTPDDWARLKGALQARLPELLDRWRLRHEVPGRPPKGMIFPRSPLRFDHKAGSFVIWTEGEACGAFKDYASGDKGDLIDLAMAIERLVSKFDAYLWGCGFLGWPAPGDQRTTPQRHAADVEAAKRAERERVAAEAKAKAQERARGQSLFAAWLQCAPIEGTPAERYLRIARGLPLDRLAKIPAALRWTRAVEWIDPETGEVITWRNAMVAARTLGSEVAGVHVTFLRADGHGKAAMERPKRMYGRAPGSAIRLAAGASGLSPTKAAAAGRAGPLAIGEGIETCLSVAVARPYWRVWAAGSLSMLGNVAWPACASEVWLLRDNDLNATARAAFDRVETRWRSQAAGRRLHVVSAGAAKDFNDLLRVRA